MIFINKLLVMRVKLVLKLQLIVWKVCMCCVFVVVNHLAAVWYCYQLKPDYICYVYGLSAILSSVVYRMSD